MKEINLISLNNSYNNLSPELFDKYLQFYSIKIKESELIDLCKFIEELNLIKKSDYVYDKFFIGYSIPQIGKEFDLLRIGDEEIINIEIKRTSTEERIKKQLIKNKYYLSFLKKDIYNFTYISDTKILYSLDDKDELYTSSLVNLNTILKKQKVKQINDLDSLFKPSDYLVSPFNSTEEFIRSKYFLTSHQEKIKSDILDIITTKKNKFISLKGKAGTGKTLLTYDIAKDLISNGKKTLIVHCGILNEGHLKLKEEFGWEILPAKSIFSINFSKYSLIIIDETQRIYPVQLTHIIDSVSKYSKTVIFSYDSTQYLRNWELNNDIENIIETKNKSTTFELTSKIRTNKEIAQFIKGLFQKDEKIEKQNFSNVEINFFNNHTDALNYIQILKTTDWKTINYTPSSRDYHPYNDCKIENESDNSHTVIGQEFNNVVAIIDEHFYYNSSDSLTAKPYSSKPYYYNPTKMLYQIVTRTRKKLNIVIINNSEVLERCLSMTKTP